MKMIKAATVVLGATLGLAALGHSEPAAAGVSVGVGIGLPGVVVAAPPVVAVHRRAPVVALKAKSVPCKLNEPMYTTPFTTAGEVLGSHFIGTGQPGMGVPVVASKA